ncbi:MAG: restriction endonuclease subunit S [Bacillota bacterium]|nr:restriction endonuclease subunit S [Bacillota bacterium]
MSVERYVDYKKSGISLVPHIPLEWESKPLKFIADCNSRVLSESTDEGAEITYIDISSVNYGQGVCNTQGFTFANAPSRARRVVKSGDTIISTVRTYLKAIAYISDEYDSYICSTGFAVFTPKKGVNSRFLFYALNADWFVSDVERHSVGISYPAITSTALSSLKTILPPFDEQEKIVTYLDRRTAEIDGLLADLYTQAKMLERYKRELIADVVTSGLDKTALRKDSGADWIGKVPSHWEMTTLRAFLKAVSVKNSVDLPLLSVEREKGVVDRETEGSENNHNRIPDDLSNYKVVRTGDFVMNKMKAWRGSYGVSRYDGIVSPAYFVFALNFPNPAFFNYAIRSTKYIGFFGRDSYGIRTDQWDFKIERIKDIPFAVPPVEEQQAIVEYLDDKIPLIEGLIADINEQIEKLKEYRQIVIHDAVTGKIKVTEG